MSYTSLEDFFGDIVGKARRGLGLSEAELAAAAGLPADDISRIESYDLTPGDEVIRELADALGLHGDKLVEVAHGWMPTHPNDPMETDRIRVERLVLDAGMDVNAYVMKCQQTGEGAVVDAGGEAGRIVELVRVLDVDVTHVLLTHGHGDHTGALQEVREAVGGRVVCSRLDAGMLGSQRPLVDDEIEEGWTTQVGKLQVQASALPGHTPGGIGFAADGAFFSGDALFAGSMGGARGEAYKGQIQAVRQKVLSRDAATRIFPGHGPLTTVGEELRYNPFFAQG